MLARFFHFVISYVWKMWRLFKIYIRIYIYKISSFNFHGVLARLRLLLLLRFFSFSQEKEELFSVKYTCILRNGGCIFWAMCWKNTYVDHTAKEKRLSSLIVYKCNELIKAASYGHLCQPVRTTRKFLLLIFNAIQFWCMQLM